MIQDDLPKDLPSFMVRFGTDRQCRDYLFAALWPEGFRCLACGHGGAYALKTAASSTRSWPAPSSSGPRPGSAAGFWPSI
jgi:hypothetical protein